MTRRTPAGAAATSRTAAGGTRQPPQRLKAKRTFGDVLLSIAASLLLAVLVLGVPFALAVFIGWPLPHQVPSLDTLSQPVTTETFIHILAALVWLAWAQFTACVLVEVKAATSGVGLPAKVPAAGASQLLARQLVAAVLLLTASAASFAPALSNLGQLQPIAPKAGAAVTATVHGSAAAQHGGSHSAAGVSRDAERDGAGTAAQVAHVAHQAHEAHLQHEAGPHKLYTVHPPHGRHHDTLWEIAERHLGDGRRYHEIYELNKHREQPDGSQLTRASLIRPGWVLLMPADAVGGDLVEAPVGSAAGTAAHAAGSGAEQVGGSASAVVHAAVADGSGAALSGGGAGTGTGGATVAGGATVTPDANGHGLEHSRERTGAQAHAQEQRHQTAARGSTQHGDTPFRLPYELATAGLLAAGLLAALGRHRRYQLWHRAYGRRVHLPNGDAALIEETIRIGADEASVRFLDIATRSLAASLAAAHRQPPAVYAARLRPDGLDLLLAVADANAPAPWTVLEDGRVWRLPRTAAADPDPQTWRTVAPFPGLVSLGTDSEQRVLVDLEAASGAISLEGPADQRRAVLAAMAAELATNSWSDRMKITLVGFGNELATLAPARVRPVATLDEVLPELESEAAERTRALAAWGFDSVLSGRLNASAGHSWSPHYVIVAEPPGPEAAARLARLATTGARTGFGYLVAGDVPGARWVWQIDAAGRLQAPLLGLDVTAQQLPDAQYAAVVELFRAATELGGDPNQDDNPSGAPASGVDTRLLERPPAVEVRLLGQLEVSGTGSVEAERAALCADALVYLLAHRDGVHPTVLASAVWPRGVTAAVRDATIERLRSWLGQDAAGQPNLLVDSSGRLRLGLAVRSDWEVFRALRKLAGTDPAQEEGYLRQALTLVRGPFLADRPPGRFLWLVYEKLDAEIPALVADTALRLAELRLAAGDPYGAIDAVQAGMRVNPHDEELWRELLRATYATGDEVRLQGVVHELRQRTQHQLGVRGLHPTTEALVDELLPSWRTALAN